MSANGQEMDVGHPTPAEIAAVSGLGELLEYARAQYYLQAGYNHFSFRASGLLKAENAAQIVPFSQEVDHGQIFIARAIRVQAPEGAKLQIYKDAVVPFGFCEVITNVQEFSGAVPGTIVFAGRSLMLAVFTEVKKEGPATAILEGDLINKGER